MCFLPMIFLLLGPSKSYLMQAREAQERGAECIQHSWSDAGEAEHENSREDRHRRNGDQQIWEYRRWGIVPEKISQQAPGEVHEVERREGADAGRFRYIAEYIGLQTKTHFFQLVKTSDGRSKQIKTHWLFNRRTWTFKLNFDRMGEGEWDNPFIRLSLH